MNSPVITSPIVQFVLGKFVQQPSDLTHQERWELIQGTLENLDSLDYLCKFKLSDKCFDLKPEAIDKLKRNASLLGVSIEENHVLEIKNPKNGQALYGNSQESKNVDVRIIIDWKGNVFKLIHDSSGPRINLITDPKKAGNLLEEEELMWFLWSLYNATNKHYEKMTRAANETRRNLHWIHGVLKRVGLDLNFLPD